DVAERFADGDASKDEWREAVQAQSDGVVQQCLVLDGVVAVVMLRHHPPAPQAAIIRDIFNPFRSATLAAACRTSTVLSLAHAAYDERDLPSGHLDPVRLSVLADALEDAGCSEPSILSHLRSPGPHVRGCWAVDLLLGRE